MALHVVCRICYFDRILSIFCDRVSKEPLRTLIVIPRTCQVFDMQRLGTLRVFRLKKIKEGKYFPWVRNPAL